MRDTQPDPQQNFQVFVRIKPLQRRKEEEPSIVQRMDNTIFVKDIDYKFADKEKNYTFNEVIAEDMNNIDTFEHAIEVTPYAYAAQPSLKHLLDGYNVAILAYGITGSGKTHTVFGNTQNPADYGLCTQSYLYLIQSLNEMGIQHQIQLSFLEIYNENVRDLLQENSRNLMLIEDNKGVNVQDLSYHSVTTPQEFEQLVQEGLLKRALAPTTFNQSSSRSHAVLQIHINFKSAQGEYCPKLTIIDLAGSEKGNFDPQRKVEKTNQEGANINKSLLALGNCINILAVQTQSVVDASTPLSKQMRNQFVPYRDSKLTRLLKDSLGGNSHTVLLACISQKAQSYEETINTLNYASRALQIKKTVTRNIKRDVQPDQGTLRRYLSVFQRNRLQYIIELFSLPQVCTKCGCVSKNDPLQFPSEDLGAVSAYLQKRMTELVQGRNESILSVKQQLKDSIDNLFLQIPKSDSKLSATSSSFNFEDRSRCVDRVCNDLQSNIEEFYEIQNSLQELATLLRENDREQYLENRDIQDRLQSALKVNLNQKEILKEILLKIGDDQKPHIAEIELLMRQQQLEMLNLLQTNQDQLVIIQKLEAELQQKSYELLNNAGNRVRSQMASNDLGKQVCENPFEQNRLNTQSEEFVALRNERSLEEYGGREALLKNSTQDTKSKPGSSSQLRYQPVGETPSKKLASEKENLQTFQSVQGSSDAYYSVENLPARESQKQPFITRIQLASPSYKTGSSQGSNTSQTIDNTETQNKRYSSIVNAFSRSNLTSLNIISNLQPKQLYSSPAHSKRSQLHKHSSGTNPLASSQESFIQNESHKKQHEGSPQIFNTSRTLAVKYTKNKPSSSNMLILD